MRSYSRRQVLLFCAAAVAITAVTGFIFVETAYPQLRESLKNRIVADPAAQAAAQREFEQVLSRRDLLLSAEDQKRIMGLWYELKKWQRMDYLGIAIAKNPVDLWMMQEVMTEVKPDYVIDSGTWKGGSALYWAHILDGLGLDGSRVITIDIEDLTEEVSKYPLWQKYVEFIHASSTDPTTVSKIAEKVKGKVVLVTLDSDHSAGHVLQELRMYGPMVSPGSYIVVEDTSIDGVPTRPDFGPGPMAGLLAYLNEGGEELFEQDMAREALVLTYNPGGWLRRRTE